MDGYMLTLRFVHILSGAFWFGAASFMALLMIRAIAAEGPAGAKVMERLIKLGLPAFFTVASSLSVVSGLLMYLRNYGSLVPPWEVTPQLGFALGGIAGLLAFSTVVGLHIPLAIKVKSVKNQIQAGGGPPSESQMARLQALAAKTRAAVIATFVLLLIAISMMSVARYLFI